MSKNRTHLLKGYMTYIRAEVISCYIAQKAANRYIIATKYV